MEEQTISLLQKCDAGVKIAVNSLENALRKTKDPGLARELEHALADHRVLNDSLRQRLAEAQAPGRAPGAMARAMAQGKMNLRYAFSPSDRTVATLVRDGCVMGERTLRRDERRCAGATPAAREMVARIAALERDTVCRVTPFL